MGKSPKQVELSNNGGKRKRRASSSTCNSNYTATSTSVSVMDDHQQGQGQGVIVVSDSEQQQQRYPLSDVVSECTKRWFQETLKEAKIGDVNMQIIVAQMYYNGYGIPKDPKKGKTWITRASRVRSSVWKISRKRPGYNASDSDSDSDDLDA